MYLVFIKVSNSIAFVYFRNPVWWNG